MFLTADVSRFLWNLFDRLPQVLFTTLFQCKYSQSVQEAVRLLVFDIRLNWMMLWSLVKTWTQLCWGTREELDPRKIIAFSNLQTLKRLCALVSLEGTLCCSWFLRYNGTFVSTHMLGVSSITIMILAMSEWYLDVNLWYLETRLSVFFLCWISEIFDTYVWKYRLLFWSAVWHFYSNPQSTL